MFHPPSLLFAHGHFDTTFWLTKERLLGIADTQYIARRATAGRVSPPSLTTVPSRFGTERHIHNTRRILPPEVVRQTLIGTTQGFQVYQVARPGHTTNRAELAHSLAGTSHPVDPLHFGQGNGDRLSNGAFVSIVLPSSAGGFPASRRFTSVGTAIASWYSVSNSS